MSWQVSTTIDSVESWLAAQSFWVQVPILLAVLIPLAWLAAGVIDRIVDRLLWPRWRRDARAAHPAGRSAGGAGAVPDPAQLSTAPPPLSPLSSTAPPTAEHLVHGR